MGIEVEDLARLGVSTLPSGSKDGIHYFYLSQPNQDVSNGDEHGVGSKYDELLRNDRQRKVEAVRDRIGGTLKNGFSGRGNTGLGLGLGFGGGGVTSGLGPGLQIPGRGGSSRGAKRSISPYPSDIFGSLGTAGMENPRAMFVRPSEVVFVLGAAE